MSKISRKDRLEIYKRTKKFLEETTEDYAGFCQRLSDQAEQIGITVPVARGIRVVDSFPEIVAFEPDVKWERDSSYWFNPRKGHGRNMRIKILDRGIRKLESQLKSEQKRKI